MPKLLEEQLTEKLGSYKIVNFKLYEENDHTLALEHDGEVIAVFSIYCEDIEFRRACLDHLVRFHGYDEDSI